MAVVGMAVVGLFAQSSPREDLARGQKFWDQRLARSAIAALESAARDRATAAEAHEALGRLYTFKGWQQENVFPGWHDEPSLRANVGAGRAADGGSVRCGRKCRRGAPAT